MTKCNVVLKSKNKKTCSYEALPSCNGLCKRHFNIQKEQRAYIVGDIHGDPCVLGSILNMIDCVHVPETTLQLWSQYDTNTSIDYANIYKKSILSIKWNKKYANDSIYLLGDIFDNVRGPQKNGIPLFGEQLIVDTILHLQKQGTIIWVIGNHDISNVVDRHVFPCSDYTKNIYCQSLLDGTSVKTEARQCFAQHALLKANAVGIAKLFDTILLCHGGICCSFLDMVKKQDTDSIHNINNTYKQAVQTRHIDSVLEHAMDLGISPDWCRYGSEYSKTDIDVDGLQRLGCSSSFVGHSIHNNISYKTHGKPCTILQANVTHPLLKNTTYFMDVGMSRAFDGTKKYACVLVTRDVKSDEISVTLLQK